MASIYLRPLRLIYQSYENQAWIIKFKKFAESENMCKNYRCLRNVMMSSFVIAATYLHLRHVVSYAQNSQKLTWDQKKNARVMIFETDSRRIWKRLA